jgi:MFS family permease
MVRQGDMESGSEVPARLREEKNNKLRRSDVVVALAITLLLQTMLSLLATTVAVLAPVIAYERGWNLSLIAIYAPLLYVGAISICFLVPWLLGKLNGMGVALGAVAADVLGLSCLLSPWPAMAILAALFMGIGFGAITPATSHLLGPRTTAHNAGMIMSVKQVGFPTGAMLAGLILPYLVTHYGWQQAAEGMILAGALIGVALLPAASWFNRLEAKAPASLRPLDPIRCLLAIPGMGGVLLAALVYAAAMICLRSLLTTYMVRDVGFGLGTAGVALGVSQAAGMFGQFIWAWLSDRVMKPRTVLAAVGLVICIGALATSWFSVQWSAPAIMVVAAAFGFSAAGFVPVILGEVARHSPPGQVGALTSGATFCIWAGAFLGPLAFGGVGWALSYRMAFTALGVGSAITAIALVGTPLLAGRRKFFRVRQTIPWSSGRDNRPAAGAATLERDLRVTRPAKQT